MSTSETFRKLPTEWLDVNDKRTGQENPIEAPGFRPFVRRERTVDLDTIIVAEPKDISTHSEAIRQKAPTERALTGQNRSFFGFSFRRASMADTERQETACKSTGDDHYASRQWFPKLTFQEISSARFIGDVTLLLLRVISLFILAVSGGMAFGHRNRFELVRLQSELFIWLHGWFFVLYPFLLWSSLLALRTLDSANVSPKRLWTFASAVFHILVTLTQVELFRLLLFHHVPRLRPSDTPEVLYSLSSSFAGQRYIMFSASLLEFYFSTVPCFVEYVLVTILLSAVWETGSIFIRDMEHGWMNIVLSIALFAFTGILASINFLITKKLPGSRRKIIPDCDQPSHFTS